MTIDPTTATLDECRDWLTRRAGWAKITDGDSGRWFWHIPGVPTALDYYESPIPETLDAAAEAMPSGWYMHELCDNRTEFGTPKYPWIARASKQQGGRMPDEVRSTGETEIVTRFRLAVACCMVDDAARKERGE